MKRERTELAMAIKESGWKQYRVAEEAGMTELRLSQIKHGRAEPTDDEQRALARVLRKPVSRVFGSVGDETQLAQSSDKADG